MFFIFFAMSTDFDPIIFRQWTEKLRGQLAVEVYDRFFSGMELLGCDSERLRVAFPADVDLARLERLYGGILEESWREAGGKALRVELVHGDAPAPAAPPPPPASAAAADSIQGISLNPDYTFETFVEGSNTSQAVSAAKAVAANPGDLYNPLLIYGGPGLGKTHLLQAVANEVKRRFPHKTIRYITAEAFRTEYTDAIARTRDNDRSLIREMDEFYRQKVDVLLMDDVQGLANTEGVQNQLFHVFNALYESKRQIVLTSDRPIIEIEKLEARLVTRFNWGLSLDIQPPDVETREAILRDKLRRMHYPDALTDENIRLIATNISSDIRTLEGVLRKLFFVQGVRKQPIDSEMIREALKDFSQGERRRVSAGEIVSAVCAEFSVDEPRMYDRKRGSQEVAYARMVAMYLIREWTKMSLKSIGGVFNGRDHSTVISAVNKIGNAVKNDPQARHVVERIKARLGGSRL